MLDLICYLTAFVLLALPAVLAPEVPRWNRLAFAGLAAFVLPFFVHAVQAH